MAGDGFPASTATGRAITDLFIRILVFPWSGSANITITRHPV